jgi:hypothetical protein
MATEARPTAERKCQMSGDTSRAVSENDEGIDSRWHGTVVIKVVEEDAGLVEQLGLGGRKKLVGDAQLEEVQRRPLQMDSAHGKVNIQRREKSGREGQVGYPGGDRDDDQKPHEQVDPLSVEHLHQGVEGHVEKRVDHHNGAAAL